MHCPKFLTGWLIACVVFASPAATAAIDFPTRKKTASASSAAQPPSAGRRVRIEKIEKPRAKPKPYTDVMLVVNSPTTSITNKPFIVIYRFNGPVSGFTRNTISTKNGNLLYFAGNRANTVFRILVLPNPNLHTSDDPVTMVVFNSPISGDLTQNVRIIAPPADTGKDFGLVNLQPHMLAHILLSKGGDNVSESNVQIGSTGSIQVGFTYPLPTTSFLDKLIPRGSVRFHIGYEESTNGSKSAGDYNRFTTANGDVLYEVLFSPAIKFIGGLTFAVDPKLESQDLELHDIQGTHDAKVEFEDTYGLKLMVEYSPFDLLTDSATFYVDAGFVILDYLPDRVELQGNSDEDILASPTRVGGTFFKLALGLRY